MSAINQRLGRVVSDIRRDRGMSQETCNDRLKYAFGWGRQVESVEAGRGLTVEELMQLSQVLGVLPGTIVDAARLQETI